MIQHSIEVNTDRCVGCALCKRDCPENNIDLLNKKARIRKQHCIKCGHCVAVCPNGAISMTNFDETPLEYQSQVRLDPEKFMQALQSRRSIRHFKAQEISAEIIEKIIEAGRVTPSAENSQNLSYILLRDEIGAFEKMAGSFLKKLRPFARFFRKDTTDVEIDDSFLFKKAPLAIVVVARGSFGKENGSLAAANMALMAEACGLGLFYSGFFCLAANYSRSIKKALDLQPKEKVVMTLVLGYPNVTYHRTVQREKADLRYK